MKVTQLAQDSRLFKMFYIICDAKGSDFAADYMDSFMSFISSFNDNEQNTRINNRLSFVSEMYS